MSNELVFKLRVDGAAPTATGVAAVGAALDTRAGKGPAVSSALGSVGDALTANQSAQAAYLLGLREQIQLFGKSSIEIERYKAAQLGVGAAAAPLILQLQNQRAAQDLAARAARDEAAAAREAAGAKKAAEASQASFVRSLQEQVAVQGKSQADLLRYRAAQLGVAKDAEQYIAAIEKSSKSTLGLSISAGQATAAMRQLPAQFTDIATQLAGGQSPFLILLQQGGQIKDSFGGVGNAIKALGSVISPVGLVIGAAAATVGVLAIAYNKGAEESQAFGRALILSGNAAGVTRDQLAGMASQLGKVVGTQGGAAEALAQLAGSGKVAAAQLGLTAEAAVRLQRDTGVAVGDTVKVFSDLGREPLSASIKLNQATNYLTVSVLEQIRALDEQGKTAAAAAVAQEAYAKAAVSRSQEIEGNLGAIEKAWRKIKDAAASAWDTMLGIGRPKTIGEQLDEASAAVERARSGTRRRGTERAGLNDRTGQEAAALQTQSEAQELDRLARRGAEIQKTQGEITQGYINAAEANKKYTEGALTGTEKINKALSEYRRNLEVVNAGRASAGLPAVAAAEVARIEKSIREQFAGPKGPSTFADLTRELQQQSTAIDERVAAGGKLSKAEELELRLNAKLQDAAGKLTAAQMASLQADAQKLVAKQKLADTAERDIQNAQQEVRNVDAMRQLREDGEREITEWLRKQDEERRKGLESITARVQAVKDEEEAVALARTANLSLAEAVERVAMARLEDTRASKVNDPAALKALDDEIKARRELMGLLGTKAAREANDQAAKDALTVWQRSADQIGQSLTDALMQGGKNAWEYIKGLFRSTVLRPIIQAAVNPIVGALGGGLGLAGSANAAGNTFGAVNGASGVFSALTGGITSNLASLAASAGSLFGSTALSTFATGMQGSTLAAGLAGPTTAGAGGALGAGAAFASAVPYIAGALALFSAKDALFGRKLQDTSITGTLGGSAGFTGSTEQFFKGGLFRSNKTTTEALGADVTSPIASAATAIRDQVQKYAVALGLPVEQIAGYTEAIKFSTKGLTAEQIQTKLQESLAGFGEKLAGTLNAELAPFAASGEKAGDTLARLATSIAGVNPVLQQLGLRVFDIGTAGAAAASQLAQQFGGLEQFAQVSASYYAAYYSQAERAAAATQSITDTLAEVGLALPTTRDEFRKLVTAQDLTTTSGSAAFTALMKVQGAFAELTVAGDEAAAAAIQAAEATAKAAEALRGQLASAIDQNIGKFLSSTQMTARQYSTISNDLAAAGINVDVGQLIGLSKDQIGELASAFLASAEASDAAKLAVVTAAGALADLKDQATAAAAALDAQLRGAIDSNVDKFLTPRERVDRQAAVLSNRLASVGINIGADELLAASVAQIGQAASAFVNAAGASVEAKTAVVEVAGALVDLKETLRQVEIQAFVDGLGLSVDELMGAYNELVPASDNLVQSWRKNRTEMETLRDALDQISGTKAVTALDTLRNTISQRDALQGVVGGIDSQIGALRAGTGDASALAYLRQREAQLWAEFASTKSPAVAQAITDNTLQRIKLEGTLQAQANQSQISALKEQIAAAERLRDLAAQMGQFIQGLRAGTLSNLSSAGRLDVQRGLFQQAISSGGDVQGQAQAYLQQAQQQFGGSTAQYSAVFEQVTAQLAALGLSGMGAGQQITDAQAQINALTSVADTSLQQITALEQLRTSFSGDVADLNASIEEQTGVLRQVLTQLEATVTNQGYQITQAGEGFLRVSGSVDNLAGAIEGGALDRAQSDALGVTA